MGVFNTPLRPNTCDPSKYRCDFSTGYLCSFKKLSCFRSLRGHLWGVFDTPLRPNTCDPSKYRCHFLTGYVRLFEKLSCFRPLRGRGVGRMQYTPTTGYVRSFEISMQFPNRVRMALQKTIPFSSPSGPRGGAYSIRPYDRTRAILRNTDAILQPGTYGSSKNCSVFVSFGAAGWGVCNTPLQSVTYDPSKYRCNFLTGYVRPFKKLSRFRPLRGRLWGVFNTPLQSGTCGPSKNCPVFVPFGAAGWAYSIGPYNWIRVTLRNTDVIPQPGTYDPSKYQYAPTTGYVRFFKIPMRSLDRRGRGVWEVGATACGGGGRE